MTPAETAIRAALAAGPTPGPWEWYSPNHLEGKGDTVLAANDDGKPYGLHSALIEHHWDAAQAKANQMLIAACNPANVAELLAELDGERNRSQMYADLVRGVAVVLHGEGYSDTSKLPEEVAALKAELDRLRAERKPLTNDEIRREFLAAGFTIKDGHADLKPYVYEAARRILSLAGCGITGDAAIDAAKGGAA